MASVFLSYARRDAELAESIADALKQRGVVTRMELDIKPGDNFETNLRESLNSADSFVVVLSPTASQSANTMFELGAAYALGKPIIAITPAGARSEGALPTSFSRRRVLDSAGMTAAEIADRVSQQIAA